MILPSLPNESLDQSNNYVQEYSALIDKAKNRALESNTYTEKHHVVPDCFYKNSKRKFKNRKGWLDGDPNTSENLVDLLPEEHFDAHILLAMIYTNHHGLLSAVIKMSKNLTITKEEFGIIKRNFAEEHSRLLKGKSWIERYGYEKVKLIMDKFMNSRHNKSIQEVEEIYKKVSNSIKLYLKNLTDEEKEKRKPFKGKNHSEKSKKQNSESNKLYCWFNNGIENRRFRPKIDEIPNGFVKGRINDNYHWYTNGIENKQYKIGEQIPDNFYKGLVKKYNYNWNWYNNGLKNKKIKIGEPIPNGFVKGMTSTKKLISHRSSMSM